MSPGVLIQSGQIAYRLGEMTRARFVSATGLPFGPSDNHLTMRRVGVSARASWKMAPSIGPLGRARRLGGVAFGASELTTTWFQIFVGRAPVIRLLAHASEAARRCRKPGGMSDVDACIAVVAILVSIAARCPTIARVRKQVAR